MLKRLVLVVSVAALASSSLAVPAGAEALDRPVIFGDSLSWVVKDQLQATAERTGMAEPVQWVYSGFTVARWEPLIEAATEQGWPVVVLALGHNDANSPEEALPAWQRVLDGFAEAGTCVVTLRTYRSPRLSEEGIEFLDTLDALVAEYPDVHTLDWASVAGQYPQHHPDDIHHDEMLQSYYVYVLWLASYVMCG